MKSIFGCVFYTSYAQCCQFLINSFFVFYECCCECVEVRRFGRPKFGVVNDQCVIVNMVLYVVVSLFFFNAEVDCRVCCVAFYLCAECYVGF